MSWHFLQGREEASWAGNSLDGAPSALLSLLPTQEAFCSQGSGTEYLSHSLSGTMCEPSTANPGGAALMLSAGDSPVRTLVQPERERESPGSEAGFGEKWPESLARWDRNSSSWKTAQYSLAEGLESFSETWPQWGMMLNGECWALEKPALGINETESGCWLPTIGKNEFRGTSKKRFLGSEHFRGAKMCEGLRTCAEDPTYLHPLFAEDAMGWPHMWTELAPLETARFRQWLDSHGKPSSREVLAL